MREEGKSNDAWTKYVGIIVGCFFKKEIFQYPIGPLSLCVENLKPSS